ncbi:MAG: ABC transporter ATP-binding protein [Candidatus Omnitrophica bacterium]|nr:ABC transporter ATP-binding protein [Candidatus Omnitrophota bacterium]
MLETIKLKKIYENRVLAVNEVDLKIEAGEIFVLLGANGAGKTTIIMLILGFTDPTSGTALINGIDVVKNPLKAKKHVAYVSENVILYGNFTARQNLDFFTKLAGKTGLTDNDYDKVLKRVGLPQESFNRRVGSFSKGMRQRLGIAIAILKDTEVILLDEPTSGLDPKGGKEFLDILRGLRDENKAIFMSSHDIFRTKIIADRVGIMHSGNLVKVIEREEMDRVDLEELYLKYIEV